MCALNEQQILWVGDARGNLEGLDVRMMRFGGKLRAFGGQVTGAVAQGGDSSLMFTSCADGFVRLHDTVTKEQLWRVFCKAPVNGCCIVDPSAPAVPRGSGGDLGEVTGCEADSEGHGGGPLHLENRRENEGEAAGVIRGEAAKGDGARGDELAFL